MVTSYTGTLARKTTVFCNVILTIVTLVLSTAVLAADESENSEVSASFIIQAESMHLAKAAVEKVGGDVTHELLIINAGWGVGVSRSTRDFVPPLPFQATSSSSGARRRTVTVRHVTAAI